ncbi:hypothetical protein [Denitromonas ohlonensis]|jgi:hypothetical protein|nr:hypothetical protein [Denitromonas ohlonensis]
MTQITAVNRSQIGVSDKLRMAAPSSLLSTQINGTNALCFIAKAQFF